MQKGTNALMKPQFEGQIVKFISPHFSDVIFYDIAVRNEKYGWLEWYALNDLIENENKNACFS